MVMAFWIAIDGKRLKRYAVKIREMEKKLVVLEKKIRRIKPRSPKKNE